jgi:hypothetical protein
VLEKKNDVVKYLVPAEDLCTIMWLVPVADNVDAKTLGVILKHPQLYHDKSTNGDIPLKKVCPLSLYDIPLKKVCPLSLYDIPPTNRGLL